MLSPVAAKVVGGRFSNCGTDWNTPEHEHHVHAHVHQDGEDASTSADEEQQATGEPGHSQQGPSRNYTITCLIGYSLSFIVFGSQVSILGPTISSLAERLHVNEPDMSPLFTALGVSCIISGTPSGWLVDRLPVHHVLIGSLLVEVGGMV